MFRIKICGITSVDDAHLAVDAGADAIGLNFVADSPRCISEDLAHRIAQAVRGRLTLVGVFVNRPVGEVNRIADSVGLDFVQLHGHETTTDCADMQLPAIKALPFGSHGMAPIVDFLRASQDTAKPLAGLLIDASVAGRYGGTGSVLDWQRVGREREALGQTAWILAGGLNPENVAQAVRQARPFGVDVASGVETSTGVKDRLRVTAFVASAGVALHG